MPDITDQSVASEQRVDAATLRVTRKSKFTGAVHVRDLPITAQEWDRYRANPRALIQNVLPRLSNTQREFLLTGTTQEEWDAVFSPEEEESELQSWAAEEHRAAEVAEREESGL